MIESVAFGMLSLPQPIQRGWGGPLLIWRAHVCMTPSKLRKLVVTMREVRKLCASYAQTMHELLVPVRVNVDTDGQAFVNYS